MTYDLPGYNMGNMETLAKKQIRFSGYVKDLLVYADILGFEYRIDYVRRCEDCLVGHIKSCHKSRLAVDILFHSDGKLVKDGSPDGPLKELGEFWESLAPDCRWGGRWRDGGHFSLEHQGIK